MTSPDGSVKKALVKLGKSTDDCWEWKGKVNPTGYPAKTFAGKDMPARRWLWMQLFGPLPEAMKVATTCGNRTCMSPHHFYACSQSQALQAGAGAKLTPGDIAEIRAYKNGRARGTAALLSARYDVTIGTITAIWGNRTWARKAPRIRTPIQFVADQLESSAIGVRAD